MILITGASGKTGRAICTALKQCGAIVRCLVRRQEQVAELLAAGAREAMLGDITSQADLETALAGTELVYHICPNMHPREVEIGEALIGAARKSRTRRIVYHSVLHPQVEAMPHHWNKLRVEEMLFASDLDFTILQPAAYMQNTLAQLNSMRSNGIFYSPYRLSARMSMVDLEDVANSAAAVLTGDTHSRAIYELCGSEILTQVDVAEAYSRFLGFPVRAVLQDLGEWERASRKNGLPDYAVNTLLKMFRYYDQHGFTGSPNVLGWLLGRPPGTFEGFIRQHLKQ